MTSSYKLLKLIAVFVIVALVATPATIAAPAAEPTPAGGDQSVRQGMTPPALDGSLTDWNGVPMMVLDLDTRAPNSSGGVDRSDALYTLQMLQTPEALYLGFHARDEKLVADSGADLFRDDALRFSVDGNKDGAGGSASDHAYRIRVDGKVSDGATEITTLTVITSPVTGGYNLEVKIPSAALALPLGSTSFKFNWAGGDDDNGGGLDTFYLYAGTGIDTPEPSWPTASLTGELFTPPGLLEAGRWEWYGGGTLGAVYAGSGGNVWAGGNGVWRTTNNGTNWNRFPLLANAPVTDARFWDASRGLALVANEVYLTEDGGATWRLSTGAGNNGLQKLTTASTDAAWLTYKATDASGSLLYSAVARSRDGGASWQQVLTTGKSQIEDIAAYGTNRAWALDAEESGTCLTRLRRTIDAGANWTTSCLADSGGQIRGRLIAFADPLTGWIAGLQGSQYYQIWRTTDGGDTWQKQGLGVEGASWLSAYDAKTAWFGSGNTIYRTTDGASWYLVGDAGPARVSFRSPSEGWGVQGRAIRHTTNGGASWTTVYTPADAPIARWWDHLRGWRINGATIERTIDGGANWLSANTGLPAVDHLQTVTPQVGWAWHNASLGVRKTTNGGATWTTQVTGSDALYDLQFVSTAHGWVRDTANNLRRTTDGGQTWNLVTPPPMPDTWTIRNVSVYFVNANVGLAGVSGSGPSDCMSVYSRTIDGGMTWSTLQGGVSGPFTFGSGQIGWGANLCDDGQGGNALNKTITAGATWLELSHPGFLHTDLHAQDVEQLFAFGQNVPVDKSSDGGASFQRQRAEDWQLTLRSRIDRVYHEEPGSSAARLIYRNTEIPAYRTMKPLVIDGNLDDWGRAWQTSLKTSTASTANGGLPTPLQSSVIMRAVWDLNNVYLAAYVYDDEIHVDTPTQPWHDDAMEISFDPAHDHLNQMPDDDRQYTIRADGSQYLWGQPTTGLEIAAQTTSDGYILEIRIPKHRMPSLKLQAGGITGFNFNLIDDIDGGTGETRLFWTGDKTSRPQATWGQIRFSAIDAETNPSDTTPTPTPTSTATATATETPSATPTATPTGQAGYMVGGKVWNDLNGNALIEPGEPGLLGVTIRLFKGGLQIGQTYTDSEGIYRFTNVTPGSYRLVAQQPVWVPLSTTMNEVPIDVTTGNVAVNFGDWTGLRDYLPMITK